MAPAVASANEADARAFFAEGRQLREAGDCAQAVVVFRRAYSAYAAGLGSLRNIAECEEELGRVASARRTWWVLRREALKSEESKYAGWEAEAEEAYEALEERVPRLTITVEGAPLSSVEVFVDDERLADDLVAVELERDPGEHRVEARRDGERLAARSVVLDEGSRVAVTLTVPPLVADPSPPPVPAPVAPTAPPASAALSTSGWVLVGVGSASLVGAAVSLGVRAGALADLEAACPGYETSPCDASVQDAVDRGEASSLLVNVLGGVGLGLVGVGASLLIVDATTGAETARLSPWIGPTGGGLRGRF